MNGQRTREQDHARSTHPHDRCRHRTGIQQCRLLTPAEERRRRAHRHRRQGARGRSRERRHGPCRRRRPCAACRSPVDRACRRSR
ncbi:MAG: hypothetical protein EOP68_19685, partial [Sphingomonas sp.]